MVFPIKSMYKRLSVILLIILLISTILLIYQTNNIKKIHSSINIVENKLLKKREQIKIEQDKIYKLKQKKNQLF
ncbi:cell division protein FtsL [Hathewaya limosa]|uniref:Cell division protein FtsL n=1 Tax=Hathewaya limosa TaxID=1536 RepID=A0ABU0JRZ1_HATLI|nr:cell division protein FtsL [Hathewaya limosa]